MFFLGVFSILAQVMFMREMLVAFFGNELSIGTILACWLIGISLGAFSARFVIGRFSCVLRVEWILTTLLIILSVMLPLQVYVVRAVRLLLHVPMGEYAPFGTILVSALVIFFPTCYSIGLFFPFACEVLARGQTGVTGGSPGLAPEGAPALRAGVPALQNGMGENCRAGMLERSGSCPPRIGNARLQGVSAVSLIYTLEAMGSMLGGAVLTFVLLPAISPYQIVLLAGCIALVGALIIVPRRAVRYILLVCAICMALGVLFYPEWLKSVEGFTINMRWRAFGILRPSQVGLKSQVRLLHSDNSIYQNLAVTESEGQFALYGNGQVMFVFPDPIGYEHSIHFIMAQRPGAKRVLLLGGNPVGDIPELLKYGIKRLVYVELDPGVGRMVRKVMADEYDKILTDRRVICILEDVPRFVQRCREQFDVVLVNAPEPTTAGANRFYTLEFYRNIRRILAEDGFMYTAVTSSERLQSEATDLGASVYQTLRAVFPIILVTAEARNRFFAGGPKAGLTFDRAVLYDRSKSANLDTDFFRPEYFLGADEITPEKIKYVEGRFSATEVPLNTNLKPVTYFYNLLLWSRFSGSGMEAFFRSVKSLSCRDLAKWLVLAGTICLLVGMLVRLAGRSQGCRAGMPQAARRELEEDRPQEAATAAQAGVSALQMGRIWSRLMIGVLIATTGFCGMALEILLIFVFQSLYGYVYTRMGLIVAMFMLGLVLGASSGRIMARGRRWCSWLAIAGVELLLVIFSLAIPRVVGMASLPGGADQLLLWYEVAIYLAVVLIGWAVGAEFPLGNRLFCDAGGTVGAAAAITDASDHIGAAMGCLVMGVILIPILGIEASCVVLAALKCAGLLLLASAFIASQPNAG